MSVLCLAATALLLASSPVSAGDWLKGKYGKRPEHMGVIEEMPFEETHYNHVPLVALPTADMPGASPHQIAQCAITAYSCQGAATNITAAHSRTLACEEHVTTLRSSISLSKRGAVRLPSCA